MHLTLGVGEMERRRAFAAAHAAPTTEIVIRPTEAGPASIETARDAAIVVPELLKSLSPAAIENFDAVVISCFGDPGLDAIREQCGIPVIGPGSAAFHLAAQFGSRFSLLTTAGGTAGPVTARLRALGLADLFASVRDVGCTVMDLAQRKQGSFEKVAAAAHRCVAEDGAEILVMGCMSMAFMPDAHVQLRDAVGVPIVNPVIAAVKTAETAVALGLHPKGARSTVQWPEELRKES